MIYEVGREGRICDRKDRRDRRRLVWINCARKSLLEAPTNYLWWGFKEAVAGANCLSANKRIVVSLPNHDNRHADTVINGRRQWFEHWLIHDLIWPRATKTSSTTRKELLKMHLPLLPPVNLTHQQPCTGTAPTSLLSGYLCVSLLALGRLLDTSPTLPKCCNRLPSHSFRNPLSVNHRPERPSDLHIQVLDKFCLLVHPTNVASKVCAEGDSIFNARKSKRDSSNVSSEQVFDTFYLSRLRES